MAFVSNPGLLAAAFIEGSAAFILLVLYWLLAPGFPKRFFRYWLTGWTAYVALGAMRIYSLWSGGGDDPRFSSAVSFVVAVLLFAAVLECTGNGRWVKWVSSLAVIGGSIIGGLATLPRLVSAAQWSESSAEFALYLVAGWLLWRSHSRHSGFGYSLLGGALMLRALHGFDRPEWPAQMLGLLRVSFHGLFGIAMGIAMAVLVLEMSRARTEELNEKLRRLAMMTAEATHSSRPRETLDGVLRQLVKSLNASHALAFLTDPESGSKVLTLEAAVGFSDAFSMQHGKTLPTDPWVARVLGGDTPFEATENLSDPDTPRWMESEQLKAMVLVRIPGKEAALGILGVGSGVARSFEKDEEHFLVNVANLLGLTWQNLKLLESAASARRQWVDTFDSISDLILVHAPDGKVLRMNRSLAWHLGVEPGLVEGQYAKELFQENAGTWKRCPYCEGAAGNSEEPDPAFGGYFFVTNSDFHDSDGNPLGTIHVLKDFTERRQAENRFRALFEKVQEGVFVSTPEGRFLDFNDSLLRILGYESRQELLDADLLATYVDPTDRDRLTRLLREHGEVTDFEFRFRRRDGEIRVARESSFVERDEGGNITAYQGFVLDVTERKQAEMEIRRRNRELLALNAIAAMLGQSSPLEEVLTRVLLKVTELFAADTGSIYFLDEKTMKLKRAASTGYRTDATRNLAVIEIAPALIQQVRQAHATVVSGSALPVPESLREAQRAEGVVVTQVVVLWSKDRIVGALVVGCRSARDFSTAELNLLSAVGNQIASTIDKSRLLEETREAYDTLRRTQEQLLQSEKMAAVGQLISGVAHELNNPLTAILGYSQLLKSEQLVDVRGGDYLEKLYKQAQRTHHIVQNLLSFSRQHKPERARVNLNQILEDTLILREYDLKLHNIQIRRDLEENLPVTGGDFNQLQQVFLNILNNAVDAIQESGKGDKGEIRIRTTVDANRIRVQISDDGPGIKNPHRVFDPFYTTKPVGKGTGLGLSICYGIVKEHGGEIQASNAATGGACFTILLPIIDVGAAPAMTQKAARAPEVAGSTVLLVDDEESVLHIEQEILRPRGITVKTARSAKEAIEILSRTAVDAVVTDLTMPGEIAADDLLRWIRKNRPDLAARIVFTLSTAHESAAAEAIRSSGCTIIQKPFALEDFWGAVQRVLAPEFLSSRR